MPGVLAELPRRLGGSGRSNLVFTTALLPCTAPSGISLWLGIEPSWPGSLAALGFLYPADCLHRAVMESALCLRFISQVTKVATQLLLLLNWYKSTTEPFVSWGTKIFYYLSATPIA